MKKRSLAAEPRVVYDELGILGTVAPEGDVFLALDCNGRQIGVYKRTRDAFQSLFARPRRKPAVTTNG